MTANAAGTALPSAAVGDVLSREIQLDNNGVVRPGAADDVHNHAQPMARALKYHIAAHKVLHPKLVRVLRVCAQCLEACACIRWYCVLHVCIVHACHASAIRTAKAICMSVYGASCNACSVLLLHPEPGRTLEWLLEHECTHTARAHPLSLCLKQAFTAMADKGAAQH